MYTGAREGSKGLRTGGEGGRSYLVEICSRIWCDPFKDLHILNELLAVGIDLGLVGTFLPRCGDDGVDQAVSPGGVKAHRVGVDAGDLAARHETSDNFFLRIRVPPEEVNSLVLDPRGFK